MDTKKQTDNQFCIKAMLNYIDEKLSDPDTDGSYLLQLEADRKELTEYAE